MEKFQVLLVEDNPDDEFLALRALRKQGIDNIVVAHDGEEALARLLGPGSPGGGGEILEPAFILLDLKLPKINGIEVLTALRGNVRTKQVPVIVISSSREETDLKCCRELDVLSCLTKPVDGKEIVGILEKAGLFDIHPS
ncbi:response regulator receiver protein [Geobacter metallireducens RCH3]|uniref:Response regulator, putative n=1 Tax=Geobacter metallireducens (strain ATCC 53774 / DSM 7210 / GS-15) TaxID=269799 RepID=Q39Q48_GEOMG|nr:response regulator [Geobacter metallireducens]ABB33626.1 response regulator, putative [Geobacter metallireducens GS-15]EHP84846.1 response regulator receiver protein [Geobacter metallireducens RCH3]